MNIQCPTTNIDFTPYFGCFIKIGLLVFTLCLFTKRTEVFLFKN